MKFYTFCLWNIISKRGLGMYCKGDNPHHYPETEKAKWGQILKAIANVVATVDKVKSFEIFRVKVWLTFWCSRHPLWIFFLLAKLFSCISANIFRYFLIWIFFERPGKIRICMYKRFWKVKSIWSKQKQPYEIQETGWSVCKFIFFYLWKNLLLWYQLLLFTATIVFLVLYDL